MRFQTQKGRGCSPGWSPEPPCTKRIQAPSPGLRWALRVGPVPIECPGASNRGLRATGLSENTQNRVLNTTHCPPVPTDPSLASLPSAGVSQASTLLRPSHPQREASPRAAQTKRQWTRTATPPLPNPANPHLFLFPPAPSEAPALPTPSAQGATPSHLPGDRGFIVSPPRHQSKTKLTPLS